MTECYKALAGLQCRAFALVINAPLGVEEPERWLLELANKIAQQAPARGFTYWIILHDSDLEDDESLKRVHLHIVLSRRNPTRGSVIINFINDLVGIDKGEVAPWLSLDIVRSLRGALRYLVHLDNPEKWSYFPDDILTNDLDTFLTACAGELELSAEYVWKLVRECQGNAYAICKALGLETYNRLRLTIRDFIKSANSYY